MLPEITLDDLRFQELVSEARTRIVPHAPEWTEHNVSDPGITLIELFAWFTEILSYRINRMPDRLHLALLDLVGVKPAPPERAAVDLRFVLGEPGGGVIPAGSEVAAARTADGEIVVFQSDTDSVVPAAGLATCAVVRGGEVSPVTMAGATAKPSAEQRKPFGDPPSADHALLLGFAVPLARLVVSVTVDCPPGAAGNGRASGQQLVWEASGGDGQWHEAPLVDDETGSLMLGGGAMTVEIPSQAGAWAIADQRLHWLRCRASGTSGDEGSPSHLRSPEITAVSAAVVGSVVSASHAATVREELLGTSTGVAGTSYPLQHRPVLELQDAETLEVRERGSDRWMSWQKVDGFAMSGPHDRHFQLDLTAGELRFGPSIRQPDGGWRSYGAVPPAGAIMRFSRYRYGGGEVGNVAPRALRLLVKPIPGVLSVTNPRAAVGGLDGESLQSARERARLEVRSRSRAVTAEDFERLTLAASPDAARAICLGPEDGRAVRVHVLPRVAPADRRLERSELTPGEGLMRTLAAALDRRRLLGTRIKLLPVRLRGVSVVVDVRASPLADLERVQHDVEHALYVYLNPLIGGSPGGPGEGWPRGRALNPGELFGIVYSITGVEFVNILRMYETDLASGNQAVQPTEGQLMLEADELIASGRHIVKAVHRE